MFTDTQLQTILEGLNLSVETLENNLNQYSGYLSLSEKKSLLYKIQRYKNMSFEVELLIGNKEVLKMLDELEDRDSGQLNRKALNT